MAKILLVNAHWNNRGDEAALLALLDILLEMDAVADITIIFKETKEIPRLPYGKRVSYIITRFLPVEEEVRRALETGSSENADMLKEIKAVSESDMVIYAPGGAVISDCFWWEKQLEYMFPIAYAHILGIKTVFAAPSVGPFNTEHPFRNELLRRLDCLCLRESLGLDAVHKTVGELENEMLSCDLAFLGKIDVTKAQNEYETYKELRAFMDRYGKVVGLTATDLSWNVGYLDKEELRTRIAESFEDFIKWLGRKGVGVLLIPQLFGEQNDENYLKGYLFNNCFLLDDKYDSNFQQYIIGELYAVVGLRYHSNIFAAKMGTPFIPVVYEQKMEGFLKDSHMHDIGIGVDDISSGLLIEKYSVIEKDYAERKGILHDKALSWIDKANRTVKKIKELYGEIS